MLSRIQKIMDEKGLSVSTFADEIGVKRPTMTHTMSGRNNPSLDIISKILERFSDISSDWLLFGKGQMNKGNNAIQQALFTEDAGSISIPSTLSPSVNQSLVTPTKPATDFARMDVREVNTSPDQKRQIDKIMIFYSDNSFETFIPENVSKK